MIIVINIVIGHRSIKRRYCIVLTTLANLCNVVRAVLKLQRSRLRNGNRTTRLTTLNISHRDKVTASRQIANGDRTVHICLLTCRTREMIGTNITTRHSDGCRTCSTVTKRIRRINGDT